MNLDKLAHTFWLIQLQNMEMDKQEHNFDYCYICNMKDWQGSLLHILELMGLYNSKVNPKDNSKRKHL